MKKNVTLGLRLLFGLIFLVFGLNGFLQFIPLPPLTPEAGQFMGALAASGYFFPFLKITEILCGAALLSNKFVPLALVIAAPINLNIFFFHIFLDMGGLPMAAFLLFANGYLGFCSYKHAFKGVLEANVKAKC